MLAICLSLMSVPAVSLLLFTDPPDRDGNAETARDEPIDPDAIEAVRQARGLQKLGRYREAADMLISLSDRGHPAAMYYLGRAFIRGWGVEPDLQIARSWLNEAVRYRFDFRAETAYEIGKLYQRSPGLDCNAIAVAWFNRSLAWGHLKAHGQLARHYEKGAGVERDLAKAFEHYEAASLAGYTTFTISYARLLASGRYGSTPNPKAAGIWAKRAIEGLRQKAREGSASSAKTLGRMHRDGEFVDRNPALARRWFLRASQLGDPGAMHDLAFLILEYDDKPEDPNAALQWLRLAASAGHGGAMTALGRLHLAEFQELDQAGAVDWLRRGVDTGHAGAMEELGRLLAEGRLIEKDLPAAIALAKRGAGQEHQGSKALLETLEKDSAT